MSSPAERSQRWRRYREVAATLAVIAAGLVGLQFARGQLVAGSAPMATATSTTVTAVPTPFPKLVAPATAQPGQHLTLLGYQQRGLCDNPGLLLDSEPLAFQIFETLDAVTADWDALLLAVDLPVELAAGSHLLDLLGAVPGGHGGDTCGDEPRHQGPIATATITIG